MLRLSVSTTRCLSGCAKSKSCFRNFGPGDPSPELGLTPDGDTQALSHRDVLNQLRATASRIGIVGWCAHVRLSDSARRILVMNQASTVSSSDVSSLALVAFENRRQRILDMTAALRSIFGSAALPIAESQPATADVGRKSGIFWNDISEALRATD